MKLVAAFGRRTLRIRAAACVATAALCAGCTPSSDAPGTRAVVSSAPELLAEGTWSLVWQEGARGLLARDTSVADTSRRPARRSAALPEVALYENGCFRHLTAVELVPLTLPGIPPEQANTLRVARVRVDADDVYFTVPGQGIKRM